MFDRLIDVLLSSAARIAPFWVIDDYEGGVVLRFGKFNRELAPGFHWIIPLAERALRDNVVPRTLNLKPQALHTKDGRAVTISAVVTAKIHDIRKAILSVETVDNVLEDSCYGNIAAQVAVSTWDEIRAEAFSETLTKACRGPAFKFGIEVIRVQLGDIALCRTFRLYQSQ